MLIRSLQDEGVEYIFGYPGGSALHIYDAIFRQQKIEHILVRHEQAATHMADGYARSTGRPGVVLVTSGPGATNAITGIATAYMDSIPMVVISGQVPSDLIGTCVSRDRYGGHLSSGGEAQLHGTQCRRNPRCCESVSWQRQVDLGQIDVPKTPQTLLRSFLMSILHQ